MKFNYYRLRFEGQRILRISLPSLFCKTAAKLSGLILGLTLLPLTALLHFLGYRHVTVFTDRIGHLALEPDCLVKEQTLGLLPRRKWILLAPPTRVANNHLLTYWIHHFIVIRSAPVCFLISNMSRFGFMRHNVSHYARKIGTAQDAYRVYADWGNRPPLLKLNADDVEWGDLMLRKLGLPDQAWFVCVHAREGGYSPIDETLHSHRNSNIENTIPAMQEIIRRGGWVLRIGDSSMRPLKKMEKVIDYAHHPAKSERLDIVLCAKARFLLGNTSGIAVVSSTFGTPCALANMIPLGVLWFNPFDISIPKLLRHQSSKKILTIESVLGSEIANYQYALQYKVKGLIVEENSAEDIRCLTVEMLDQLDGKIKKGANEHAIQLCAHGLINQSHYAYKTKANFSLTFLKNHPELLQSFEKNYQDNIGGIISKHRRT